MSQTVIETRNGYTIRCPVCQWHSFPKQGKPGASWTFNGNFEKPTFTPSMNESTNSPEHPYYNPRVPSGRCHFILTDGVMNFCSDCTHELAGQSRPLEPWPEVEVKLAAANRQAEGW